ncbi:MAG: hypothetical protein OEV42_08285 [Deltaproteobacteria bacterium]|nr:hypothetical protein [Deltaproteobacteria bacterium]
MPKKASIAKITAPLPGNVFERERLYNLLDQRRPLTWISGPGGAGKTTLTASYLNSRKIPHIWYRLDAGDEDIATFFHYMGLAEKKAAPRRKKLLPHLTPEFMMGIPTFAKRFFEELYNHLAPPAVIVIDDYQEVSDESGFHNIINSALSVLPHGISVIIMSRGTSPEVFSRLQLNRMMTVIDWETLRLNIEETAGISHFINPAVTESINPDVLHQKTGGWIGGLNLILESVYLDKLSAMLLNDETPETIFNYFTYEYFCKLDKESQTFLLKTAFMPSMTLEMARNLTGVKQARHLLSVLYKNNCFLEKHMQSPPVYQYHPLFRSFLLNEAMIFFSEEERDQTLRHAATLLSQSGQVEEAAKLMIETGDPERLISLILENAQVFVGQGRNRVVEAWILAVPEPIREENPWLIFWLGSCKISYNIIEARAIFKKSFQLLDSRKDAAGAFLSWCGVANSILWGWDDFKSFDGWINILNDLVKKYKGIPEGEIETRISTAMFSAIILHYPDHPQFELWKSRALSIQETNSDLICRMVVLAHFSYYLHMCGKLEEADEVILLIKSLVSSSNPSCLEVMQAQLAEIIQANFSGDHDQCLKLVDKSLEISSRNGLHLMDAMIAGQALWCSFKCRYFERTAHYMKIIESSLSLISPFERSFYHFLKAFSALHNKNISLAERECSLSLQIVLEIGVVPPLLTVFSLRAYTLHELGKYEEASEALSEAINYSLKFDSNGYTFEFSLLEAYFSFQRRDEAAGLSALKAGLGQGRERGYKGPLFFCLPELNSGLYAKALSVGMEVEYVQQLIRKSRLLPPEDMTDLENWPWAIRVYTLGQFRLVINGETVHFSGKSRQKPLNMLKAIISLGGRGVRGEDLANRFWPEAEGDAAYQSFKTTLHRLRKLLCHENSVHFAEGVINLDPDYFWVDAWEFERLVDKIDLEWRKKDSSSHMATTVEETERAIRLYPGSFLSQDSWQPWSVSLRDRLRSKFLRIVKNLGNYRQSLNQVDSAIHCYQRGIETDPLVEEFYQSLIKCYQKTGNKADAMATYHRCRKVFSSLLNIEPSAETVSLFRELKSLP